MALNGERFDHPEDWTKLEQVFVDSYIKSKLLGLMQV